MVGGQCKSGFSINLCGIATICGGLSVLKGCRGLRGSVRLSEGFYSFEGG